MEREDIRPITERATLTWDELERLFIAVLREVRMIASGKTVTLDKNGSKAKQTGNPPPSFGDEFYPQAMTSRFVGAKTNGGRRAVIWECLSYVRSARYSPDQRLRRGTEEWRLAVARDKRPTSVIERVYGVTRAEISRCRAGKHVR